MDSEGDSRKERTESPVNSVFRSLKDLKPNRNFWTFMVFLCVSVLFWCIQTFNGYTSVSVSYDIGIVNLPSERIVTSYIPESVTVSISGRGFSMLGEMFGNNRKQVVIDYSTLPKNGECATIDFNTWKKIFSKVLDEGVTISSVSISPLEIYTSIGRYKQVPVISKVKMSTAKDHLMLSSDISPQYVNVYAPNSIYDTISAVYTEPKVFPSLSDTTVAMVAIEPMRGVKVVPDSVKVTMCVDLLTSKSVKVPVTVENLPDDYIVKTFPRDVEVSFRVSSSMYGMVTADDFSLAVDYRSIVPRMQECEVFVRTKPDFVTSLTLNPSKVEFIIERCRKSE